jgi:acetyl esterase
VDDDGVIDPWVVDWFAAHPERAAPFEDLAPQMLELARSPVGPPPTREIADVTDDVVEGVPVRIYRDEGSPTGVLVYFHGGGFVMGSIGLMDEVARELSHGTGAAVVSVGYRLAPEHPYPAGLDDCETVTRWAYANAEHFGVSPSCVAVAGESAGGNLAAALALRLKDAGGIPLAGQVLIYPAVAGAAVFPSTEQFDGLVVSRASATRYWDAYCGGRDLEDEPCAAPLRAAHLDGLPPALVVLGGCDVLRDEGRAYAARLREEGVDVEEVCYPGQPHGFVNFGLPAASLAFDRIGNWVRRRFGDDAR